MPGCLNVIVFAKDDMEPSLCHYPCVQMRAARFEEDLDAGEMGGTIVWAEPEDSECPFCICWLDGRLAK